MSVSKRQYDQKNNKNKNVNKSNSQERTNTMTKTGSNKPPAPVPPAPTPTPVPIQALVGGKSNLLEKYPTPESTHANAGRRGYKQVAFVWNGETVSAYIPAKTLINPWTQEQLGVANPSKGSKNTAKAAKRLVPMSLKLPDGFSGSPLFIVNDIHSAKLNFDVPTRVEIGGVVYEADPSQMLGAVRKWVKDTREEALSRSVWLGSKVILGAIQEKDRKTAEILKDEVEDAIIIDETEETNPSDTE